MNDLFSSLPIRDLRQEEFANVWLNTGKFGILHLAPRFGKIRVAINIMEVLKPERVLIVYPDMKIKQAWIEDFAIRNYDTEGVVYTTYLSLKKHEEEYDLIILDEIHLISPAQTRVAIELLSYNKQVLGLTGTLSAATKSYLKLNLRLKVVGQYTIAQGIDEGILTDYQIVVIHAPLDRTIKIMYPKGFYTEAERYGHLSWAVEDMTSKEKNSKFLRIMRMRLIQNSFAKKQKTIDILHKYPDERILVFCGITAIADSLGIPSYHSKSSEKKIFEEFANGLGNHLAVVKIGNTGITYKPLNKVIINYFDSNAENMTQKILRSMSMEYDNPDKKALIYIITTDEYEERNWLDKSLAFFDKTKIRYV
jgi:superfamily II DNA or RNA helicase